MTQLYILLAAMAIASLFLCGVQIGEYISKKG